LSDSGSGEARRGLPPLVGEHHVCDECGVAYSEVSVEQAVRAIEQLPAAVRDAAEEVPTVDRRIRPQPGTWSVVEYVCHLRDVFATYTVRLHRTRTEDQPVLEPMLNDLRARRFRYNERDLPPVVDELTANVRGFCEEVAKLSVDDLDRTASRFPDETVNGHLELPTGGHGTSPAADSSSPQPRT
jgi:hypothetical protein